MQLTDEKLMQLQPVMTPWKTPNCSKREQSIISHQWDYGLYMYVNKDLFNIRQENFSVCMLRFTCYHYLHTNMNGMDNG